MAQTIETAGGDGAVATLPVAESVPAEFGSPPPAAMPQRAQEPDARGQLLRLADELRRSHNRRLLVQYLQLRRAVR